MHISSATLPRIRRAFPGFPRFSRAVFGEEGPLRWGG